MFGEFARSAEAVFSRWAIKRVCKFLLKKKLGDLILGDIDLDQLDVQLGQGTIQLSDLALNVDYLNQKLTGAAVMVKEGSIGSLSMKIPWKLKNCQIEVEELELVLAPNVGNKMPRNADCCNLSHDGEQHMCIDADKLGGTVQENPQVTPMDVHEGVKTIAKIVKWLLTSFHVRLKKLIIAYDPSLDAEGKKSSSHRSLVLRISEVEYGTCISEDDSIPALKLDCLLGIGKLTNFIKFEGVVVEFLQMDNIDNQSQVHGDLSTSFSEWYAGSSPSCCTTILTGSGGGFSGKMNVSIPWKNGSVDFYKVDADISVNPVEVSIQKDTIMWIIAVWESLRNVNTARESHIPRKAEESSALNSEFRGQLDSLGSPVLLSNKATPGRGSFSKNSCSTSTQDTDPEGLLPCANVIQNWVPLSLPQEMQVGLESDYGASIDQFFECFDEFRSSQTTLGNSGIWNWTCSVFSAITVASNLASGSTQIPTDQRHVETNIQASLGEISVILSFLPEEQEHSQRFLSSLNHMNDPYGMSHSILLNSNMVEQPSNVPSADSFMSCVSTMNVDQSSIVEINSANPDVHHLDARFQHVTLNLQIHHQKMNLEASVMYARVDMFYDRGSISRNLEVFNHKSSSCAHMPLSESLQIQVQGALHPFPQHYGKKEAAVSANTKPVQSSTLSQKGMAKVVLFETFGACRCQYAVRSTYLDGRTVSSVSFIINLPPFVLWVHLPLVNILLNFCKEIQISLERSSRTKDSISDVLDEKNGSSLGESKTNTSTYITTLSESANTQGNILLPHARIVLCFPTVKHGDSTQSTSWSKFIVFEFSPFPDLGKVPDAPAVHKASSSKGDFCAPSTSIHANIGSIDGYLVTSQFENTLDEEKCSLDKLLFSAKKVFSMTTGTNDHHFGISMQWQKGPVTGPWMASRTWSMATSHDQRSRNKVTGEGYEFSSVKTAEDLGETNSHIRQELVLSSAFFLRVHFSQVWINLGRHDYELLNHLLSNLIDGLPDKTHGIDTHESFENSPNDSSPTQVSILVECDLLDFCINLDSIEISCSVQKELQGSWNNLRLTVGKFELLSVLNIGGIVDANFLWMNHGEGELRGSIVDRDKKPPFNTQDLLLISCSNSTIKRGDGEGANALSFGSAGTTITHIKNPTLHQIFTSITLQCGTFVVPGGRMDWISALSCFFTLPQGPELADSDNSRNISDADDAGYLSSFFLELVDIALSFEPHKFDEAVRPVEESCEKYVACLLAAASLNVSHHAMANSSTNEYKFQLQDVGLLICESSGSKSNRCDYSIDYLRKAGFVKVAHEALVGAVLRIKGVTWEIECQEAHINLDSCSDTTDGLSRLVSQLQQLYAPDLEDALVHLQSRWNTVQQEHSRIIDEGDTLDRLSVKLSSENNLSTSSEDVRSVGLLDEIHENAFYMDLEHESALDHCDSHGFNRHFLGDNCGLNSSNGISCDTFSPNIPHEVPMRRSELKPHIIDSYYVSDFVAPSKVSATDGLHNEDCKYKHYNTGNKDVECGNGRWYKDDSLMIVENHLSKIVNQPSGEEQHEEVNFTSVCSVPVDTCRARGRILLKNIDVTWRIYAGFDWCKPRENLLCGLGSNGRDGTVCLELKLSGLNLQYDVYPEEQICASKLSVSVQDFHLYDRSKDAPWKMVLGYYHSKNHPRESCAKAFKLDLEVVKPDPLTPLEEYRLHLELLPIRLHLDQSQLNFLIHFFGKDADRISSQPNEPNDVEKSEISGKKKVNYGKKAIVEEALLPFFQKCDVRPVVVRVDYIPRRVDLAALRGGNYAELLNLVPWKGIDLQLKHVCAVGVYGWNSICETVLGQWLEDISHNQVHKLLKGLPPIRSLYAVGSGASKLVSLPIKSYKKDHKLLKGMQRGARAFIRSISLEAVGLGVHLAAGAHEVLLQTEYILTSIPPSMPSSERDKREMTVRSNQPKDAQQGIRRACESISDGLGRTASALVGTPFKTYQRGGGAGPALVTAIRAAPAAAMAPVSASARAVHCALLGVRNSLDPEHKKESIEKYLGHQQ